MAEILGWELNLATELQPGATFRVVYEELVRSDTLRATPGRVLAVEMVSAGRTATGYYFAEQDGTHRGYYDRRGEALGRAFLRYPVNYSRVSSQFSRARFHPVLKRHQAHNGVDFAAPQGTPVAAVADGTIARAGWQGSYGRYIKIRHDGIYGSGYAHLSRIAAGVAPGARVQKGQIIGYVGASGRATGPHLHFEMYRHDQYINPLTADLPRGRSLSGGSLTSFRTALALLDGAYGEIDGQYASGPREDTSEPVVTQVAQATGFGSR
jgi:murein DD-endopeptidase MepM/ murein hydrolase activator NlpD